MCNSAVSQRLKKGLYAEHGASSLFSRIPLLLSSDSFAPNFCPLGHKDCKDFFRSLVILTCHSHPTLKLKTTKYGKLIPCWPLLPNPHSPTDDTHFCFFIFRSEYMDVNCKDIWALRHFCDHMEGEVTSAHSTKACPLGNG